VPGIAGVNHQDAVRALHDAVKHGDLTVIKSRRVPARSGPLDRRLSAEEIMRKRRHIKLVREGTYAADVEVELIDAEGGWAPYISLIDAGRLDQVREALRRDDLPAASRLGRVFRLTPVSA
jgi:hypothetical protein